MPKPSWYGIGGCVKWSSPQMVGRWQSRQCVGLTCGAAWHLSHGFVGAVNTMAGWHKAQGRDACCVPRRIGAGCSIVFVGLKARVV